MVTWHEVFWIGGTILAIYIVLRIFIAIFGDAWKH